jgi:phosphonate transport system substrate-binding protein
MNPHRRLLLRSGLLLPAFWLAGCDGDEPARGPQYLAQSPLVGQRVARFGVHPLHNPQKLHQVFDPFMAYLNQRVADVRFELEASNNYAHFEAKLRAREMEFALPNPYQALIAQDWGYRVIAKLADDNDFRGLIFIRRDSRIRHPLDLKGKAVCYPAPTALAATMLPRHFLATHGLDLRHDVSERYVGSMESSLMNVVRGQVAAAGAWPPPWRQFQREHPQEAAQIMPIWQTQALPSLAVMARLDAPEARVTALLKALEQLHVAREGRGVFAGMGMEGNHFRAAGNSDYAPVRAFIDKYARLIGSA